MTSASTPSVSLEAITYRNSSPFFAELIEASETILADKAPLIGDDPRIEIYQKLIKKHSGMNIKMVAVDSLPYGFCVSFPTFDPNNILHRLGINPKAFGAGHVYNSFQAMVRMAKTLDGSIDRQTGKVSGFFESITATMYLPSSAFGPDTIWSATEIAAIILHEAGHVFSAFEAMGNTLSTSSVVVSAAAALKEEAHPVKRLKIIDQTMTSLSLRDKTLREALNGETDSDAAIPLLLKSASDARALMLQESSFAIRAVDYRSVEFLADQFAIRHGAAIPLARALRIIDRYDSKQVWVSSVSLVGSVLRVIYLILLGTVVVLAANPLLYAAVIAFVVATVYAEGSSHAYQTSINQRIADQIKDLIQIMKSSTLSKRERGDLMLDYETLIEIQKTIKDDKSLYDVVWANIFPAGRKFTSLSNFQRELEGLTNNDFFVAANKLQTLPTSK